MGTLRCVSFCPDQPNILMIGGQKEDLIHIYDVARDSGCAKTFTDLHASAEVNPLDKDVEVDVEMDEAQ